MTKNSCLRHYIFATNYHQLSTKYLPMDYLDCSIVLCSPSGFPFSFVATAPSCEWNVCGGFNFRIVSRVWFYFHRLSFFCVLWIRVFHVNGFLPVLLYQFRQELLILTIFTSVFHPFAVIESFGCHYRPLVWWPVLVVGWIVMIIDLILRHK